MNRKALIDEVRSFTNQNDKVIDVTIKLLNNLKLSKSMPKVRATFLGTILLEWNENNHSHRTIEILGDNYACLLYMPEEIIVEVNNCLEYSYDDFLAF